MGSSFDLFGDASHYYENKIIPQKYKKMRTYLKNVMEKHGFEVYAKEWWHFTYINEPFARNNNESYFDFEIE